MNEPVVHLAAIGELTEEELAKIARDADEARGRIGTDAERNGSGGRDWPDRRAVKLHEAVARVIERAKPTESDI
jgi:hypothetical protein